MEQPLPYSEKVMDHFNHPRNVGELADANGVGKVGNPVCGDVMKMYLKIEQGIIVDVKFKTLSGRIRICHRKGVDVIKDCNAI